jgi:membrane-bound serine protease (ClpP class)
MLFGILAVLTPGTGIIEVGAFFALALAGWAVYNLEVNLWAFAILVLGVFPFLIAVRRSGQLVYLAVAIGALVIGSTFLFRGEGLRPAVNPVLAVITSVLSGGFLWVAASKTLEAIEITPAHDLSSLIGETGETRTDVHEEGSVYVAGELWTARSSDPIPSGVAIRVVGREGFLLEVEQIAQGK